MTVTEYTVHSGRISSKYTFAVVADLHGAPADGVLAVLRERRPDAILLPGDLMEDTELGDPASGGYQTLSALAALAPTFYSLGNHEMGAYHRGNHFTHPLQKSLPEDLFDRVAATGACLLHGTAERMGELCFCGIPSGLNGRDNAPDEKTLARFSGMDGARILLCHHPEYYPLYLKAADFDLILSGHAHGGQWRLFGLAAFAPGQGILPRYTAGVIDGRMVISRGLGNHTHIPRIFNPPELVLVHFLPQN